MVQIRLKFKMIFAKSFTALEASGKGPWVIGRDFNVFRFVHEKNKPGHITRSMREFGSFVNQCSLWDCALSNAKFTWTNDQDNPTLCHMGHFLISNCWKDHYTLFVQEDLPKIASDHWPIMYGPAPFRFENM